MTIKVRAVKAIIKIYVTIAMQELKANIMSKDDLVRNIA
jgi:hypothetical protein